MWKCYRRHPLAKFSLKVGTIFEDSPLPFSKWLQALWLLTNCKNGISSYELARQGRKQGSASSRGDSPEALAQPVIRLERIGIDGRTDSEVFADGLFQFVNYIVTLLAVKRHVARL